jgi:hypothetical protein
VILSSQLKDTVRYLLCIFWAFSIRLVVLLVVLLRPSHWEFSIEDKDIKAIKFPTEKDFVSSEDIRGASLGA